MADFGSVSKSKLNTCCPEMIDSCNLGIKHFDFSVVCGHRIERLQTEAFEKGYSKSQWLESPHNYIKSFGADCYPYYKKEPHFRYGSTKSIIYYCSELLVDTKILKELLDKYSKEKAAFYTMSAIIKMSALHIGVELVSGSCWKDDWNFLENKFDDLGHLELKNWRNKT